MTRSSNKAVRHARETIEALGDDDGINSVERQRVLDALGLMSEGDLALLYRCGRKSMQNRPRSELPPFFRAGGQRLFFKADVVEFFKARTIE